MRLWRAQSGVTAVEMGLLMPIFLLFLLGVVEGGRLLWTQTSLQFAVEAAARCAAINPNSCLNSSGTVDIPGYAATQAYGMSIPAATFTCKGTSCVCGASDSTNCTATGPQCNSSNGVEVAASYTFSSIVGKLIPAFASITLGAKSCHP